MADSLREAAEEVVERFISQGADCRCSVGLTQAVGDLRIALSAPDPVAEAREIIAGLCDMRALCWKEPSADCRCYSCCLHRAKGWLERNGGDQ